eukprot:TRINITY_DN4375_c0_g1_i2.p1 TRINITY_DN4375_c0_g1~~TRINITY_DN4375_c0_g1_i2.p1  ORF type:complete len:288 (+),score=48.58 TRINITY_DN4375_c0_g1_i2:48-911(+)
MIVNKCIRTVGFNSKYNLHRYSTKSFKFIEKSLSTKGVVTVTLNRPILHNAFNEEVIQEVTEAFADLDHTARLVILTANGKTFSAGADLNWMQKMVNYTKEENEEDSKKLYRLFAQIKGTPVPVIGKINGSAVGGGCGLVSACDIAFALGSANFGFSEVKLGLIPATISPFVIEKIGVNNARRYFITGERFSAVEAKRIGLINDHFADLESLDAAVTQTVDEILQNSPEATKAAKQLIEDVSRMSTSDPNTALFTARQIAQIRVSQEGQEGLRAFLEKRKPYWLPKN